VDAAIATELCVGTINAFSAGIGGGGLMLIRLPNGTAEFIDCRETAPKFAKQDMYKKNKTLSSIGGLAPSIKLSRYGFPIPPELALRLESIILSIPSYRAIYAPKGKILTKGEMLYRFNFSKTLEAIANNYTEFYEGYIAKSLVNEINAQGGIITFEDFVNYQPVVRKPTVGYYPPGKRPLSSTVPTIVENEDGELELVLGGSGGSRILTAVLQNTPPTITKRGEYLFSFG
ncbi:7402_t:CDS:2, partial [Racocetra fulgida]